jgi:hypothetical protein
VVVYGAGFGTGLEEDSKSTGVQKRVGRRGSSQYPSSLCFFGISPSGPIASVQDCYSTSKELQSWLRHISSLIAQLSVQAAARILASPNWALRAYPVRRSEELPKKTPHYGFAGGAFSLVDPARENWNYLFEGLIVLCERLEEFGIKGITQQKL